MTRAARRLIRSSSVASRSGSPVSHPSESTITIVRRSTRCGHSRLSWASDSPMRVPHVGQPPQNLALGASAQILGDAREPRREREGLDPAEDALQGEQELEQEAAVEIHRARDVTQQHEANLLALALAKTQVDQIALGEVGAKRAPEVDAPAPPDRLPPSADPVSEAARDLDGELQELVELVGAEGREVLGDQRLALGGQRNAQRVT